MNLYDIYEIKSLLVRYGFRFSKSMGQNFLIEKEIPEKIAASCHTGSDCAVLEIGPGIGSLTSQLLPLSGKVIAVELDKSLKPLLGETLSGFENFELIFADFLKLDIKRLVQEHFGGLRPIVCANLPYNITSPLLIKLIESEAFENITVMIQREVAQRICAKPASGDYGAFTVFANYYTLPEILFDVPPECFIPQPKVYSSVISLKPQKRYSELVENEEMFFKTVRAAFAQRRKTLLNSLSSVFGKSLEKSQLSDILESCGISPLSRGEELDIPAFARLSGAIYSAVNATEN